MISYKEITNDQIDKMNLSELQKYIESYGAVLLRRIELIKNSSESIERNKAYQFNVNALKGVAITTLSNTIGEDVEFKQNTEIIVARARLKNLVASLRASGSTITGQKQLSTVRRQKVRSYLKNLGINKHFSNKQLDILDEVFAAMDHGRGDYESGEIIRGFNAVAEEGDTVQEIVEKIEAFLKGVDWESSPLAQYF